MTVTREAQPAGRCSDCDGPLVWSRVRYLPAERVGGEIVPARWEGVGARCAMAPDLRGHDLHAPFLGRGGPVLRLA